MISSLLKVERMKAHTLKKPALADGSFGKRLALARKAQGLTQAALAEKLGVSRRVVAYYETEAEQPPGPMLANLANLLAVSVDELLGRQAINLSVSPISGKLMSRLREIESLPVREQQAILIVIDSLLAKHQQRHKKGVQEVA